MAKLFPATTSSPMPTPKSGNWPSKSIARVRINRRKKRPSRSLDRQYKEREARFPRASFIFGGTVALGCAELRQIEQQHLSALDSFDRDGLLIADRGAV